MIYCIWSKSLPKGEDVLFDFVIDMMTSLPTKKYAKPTSQKIFENESIRTPTSLIPYIFNIGPYVIKNTGQPQILFNPTYSLKRVELSMQINVSVIKSICLPFLGTSYAGWCAWLHERTLASSQRLMRDVTGILGRGLGVLNSLHAEILANKLVTTTGDLNR